MTKAPWIIAGGIASLALAIGLGRFAYTPILPAWQQANQLGDDWAGWIAAANHLGYMLGALYLSWRPPRHGLHHLLWFSLAAQILSLLGMAFSGGIIAWAGWRILSGLASAGLFILPSGLVLYYLGQQQRLHWSGYLYTGIGGGIALSGIFVPPLLQMHSGGLAGWQSAWLGMAGLGVVLGGLMVYGLRTAPAPPRRQDHPDNSHSPHNPWLKWLSLAYFCEGIGYIISGTFLVAMFSRMPGLTADATHVWIWVGLAGIPGSLFWAWVAKRTSYWHALFAAHWVQAAGMLAPVMVGGTFSAYFSAISFGGTFISIVGLTLTWGKTLEPHRATQVVSILTLAFSLGQIAGPIAAGQLSVLTGNLQLSLWLAAAVVILGAMFLALGRVLIQRKSC